MTTDDVTPSAATEVVASVLDSAIVTHEAEKILEDKLTQDDGVNEDVQDMDVVVMKEEASAKLNPEAKEFKMMNVEAKEFKMLNANAPEFTSPSLDPTMAPTGASPALDAQAVMQVAPASAQLNASAPAFTPSP
jgi:hypothetical protein